VQHVVRVDLSNSNSGGREERTHLDRKDNMRALASSIALPFLSHIARQSYSCSAPSDATASTSFLVAYALSIIAHGTLWIDECVDVGWFRLVLVCAGVTFGIAVGVHRIFGPGVWFGVCWTAHAIPSAALWPISFRLVNLSTSKKRLDMSNYRRDVRHAQYDQYPLHHPLWRALLVLWSLQGNAGDAVGCVLSSYIFGTPTNGTQDGEFEQGSGIEVLLHTNASASATSSPSQRVWLELTIACVFCCACLIPPLHMEAGADDSRSSSSNGVATPALRSALPTSSANSALHMLSRQTLIRSFIDKILFLALLLSLSLALSRSFALSLFRSLALSHSLSLYVCVCVCVCVCVRVRVCARAVMMNPSRAIIVRSSRVARGRPIHYSMWSHDSSHHEQSCLSAGFFFLVLLMRLQSR
jgi:hypothetical protein